MPPMTMLRAVAIAALLALPAAAQEMGDMTTSDEVRAEISEAMDAIAAYPAQESELAREDAREPLTRLDAEIERREDALRENWSEMTDEARDTARARMADLREARNRLGERYGALESGTSGAWDELKTGFSDAWTAFSDAWTAADEDDAAN